jgi:hypothetical protein
VRRERRRRPAVPYRAYPVRRVLIECNRRLRGVRGPRAFEALAALIYRSPQVQSGVVYIGDCCAGEHRSEHCCMAQLMRRCGRTAHRAKYDLADAGLIKLHNAGRGLCPCSRCGGDQSKKAGGSILNAHGQVVGAATGYELDPSLFAPPRPPRPPASASAYRSPAQARAVSEGQARLAAALERMRPPPADRAGP